MEEVTVLWTSSDPCLWETVLQSLQQCWSTWVPSKSSVVLAVFQ